MLWQYTTEKRKVNSSIKGIRTLKRIIRNLTVQRMMTAVAVAVELPRTMQKMMNINQILMLMSVPVAARV